MLQDPDPEALVSNTESVLPQSTNTSHEKCGNNFRRRKNNYDFKSTVAPKFYVREVFKSAAACLDLQFESSEMHQS